MKENVAEQAKLLTVQADDADEGVNAKVTYSLKPHEWVRPIDNIMLKNFVVSFLIYENKSLKFFFDNFPNNTLFIIIFHKLLHIPFIFERHLS